MVGWFVQNECVPFTYEQLSKLVDLKTLEEISHEISLEDSIKYAAELMAGNVRGRLIVDVNK